jgi:hypothetical protein
VKLFLIKTKPASIQIVKQIKLFFSSIIVVVNFFPSHSLFLLVYLIIEAKIDWWKTHFDYLNFPSTWRDIYFTPFENYSVERQTRQLLSLPLRAAVQKVELVFGWENNIKLNWNFTAIMSFVD